MNDKQACEPGACAEGTPLTCEGYGCAKESKTIPEIRQSLPCADCGGETRHAESCPIPAIGTTPEHAEALLHALRGGAALDPDGVFVKVSRQACEEAADLIERGSPILSQGIRNDDTARLDWLESQVREYGDGRTEPHEASLFIEWQQPKVDSEWKGLRTFIDAAMEERHEERKSP